MFEFFMTPSADSTDDRARATVRPIDKDAVPAAVTDAPDFNTPDGRDDRGVNLGTVVRRDTASATTVEGPAPVFLPGDHAEGIRANDGRQASLGLYAARELAGAGGHRPMPIVEGLEPTVRDEARLGNLVMQSNEREINGEQILSPAPLGGQGSAATSIYNPLGARVASLEGIW